MAISVTNSQGTKVYVFATAGVTVASYTDFTTAVTGGKEIGCLQDLGSLSETRSVQEYTCLGTSDSTKASGSVTRGNFTVSMLFDALDTAGQAELRTLFANNSTRTIGIELSDNSGTSPTVITFEGFVSGQEIAVQKDNAVMINSTVEIASAVSVFDAIA